MAEKPGYTDNFMVPEEEITAFAGKVKEAVADRDMDALAPWLLSFVCGI